MVSIALSARLRGSRGSFHAISQAAFIAGLTLLFDMLLLANALSTDNIYIVGE